MKILFLILTVMLLGCEPVADSEVNELADEGEAPEIAEPTVSDDIESTNAGSITNSLEEQNTMAATVTNVKSVSDNSVPGSLALPGVGLSMALMGLNPCSTADGLFDCQPNLVRTYIGFSKLALLVAHALLYAIEDKIKVLAPGSSGILESTDTGEVDKISYEIEAEDKYKLLLHSNITNSPLMHLTVSATSYHIVSAMRGLGDAAVLDVEINFTDESNFNITQKLLNVACQSSDARSPERVVLYTEREASTLQGNAMIYMPRGLVQSPSCDDEATATTKVALYSEYVGNAASTTAAIFMMPVDLSSLDAKADYAGSEFCSQFPGLCEDGKALGDTGVISTSYENPICIKSLTHSWGGACSDSSDVKVAAPTYASGEQWYTPEALLNLSLAIPEVL